MNGKIIIKIASVWAACFIIGLIWGRVTSPDYSVRGEIEKQLEKDINLATIPRPLPNVSESLKGLMIATPVVAATYRGDLYSYVYTENGPPVRKIRNHNIAYQTHKKGMDQTTWVALLVAAGVPAGPNLKDLSPIMKSGNSQMKAVVIIGGILGIGLGYKLAHADHFDSDSNPAQAVLNDPAFWEGMIARKKAEQAGFYKLKPLAQQ